LDSVGPAPAEPATSRIGAGAAATPQPSLPGANSTAPPKVDIERTRSISRLLTLGVMSGVLLGGRAWWKSCHPVIDRVTIPGFVVDDHGPLAGATVTAEGRDFYAQSGQDGAFRGNLMGVTPEDILTIHISADGHRQETRQVQAHDSGVNLYTV